MTGLTDELRQERTLNQRRRIECDHAVLWTPLRITPIIAAAEPRRHKQPAQEGVVNQMAMPGGCNDQRDVQRRPAEREYEDDFQTREHEAS